MSINTVYIGLGSNLSNPVEQLNAALKSIALMPSTQLIKSSSFYGSKPLGPQDQPDFINAVCEVETELKANDLLKRLQAIELEQGRIKKRHWGERLIDLDILLFGNETIIHKDLVVPHSQIALRDFVLIPLSEIAPGLVIPHKGKVETLISALTDSYLMPLN